MTHRPEPQPHSSLTRQGAHLLIRFYQLTLSSLIGRQCRYAPSCSDYMDEAIQSHGLWAGGWMGFSRLCRCHPWGGSGYDPVPSDLPLGAGALRPWRYGTWRSKLSCEGVEARDPNP
ncbi:MAG: membrane protein insertion efficiency factor YidD [Alphaproteobacteria bacterium]|nr:membrane protein insertion efficiency factor YidD [Alphaproteobacteria bacterium]